MSYLSISHLIAYVLILLWPLTSIHWGRKPERPACCHFLSLCVTRTELSSCLDICCWLSMSLCWVFYSLSRSLLTPVPHSTPTPCPAASPALVLPCWTLCHQKAGCLFLMWSRRARTALRLVFTLKMLFYSQNLGIKSDCAVGKRVQWISNVSVKLKSPASPETGISSTSDLNFFSDLTEELPQPWFELWWSKLEEDSCTHARWEVDSFRSFCIFKKQMRVPKDGVNMCVMMQQWKKTAALLQGV